MGSTMKNKIHIIEVENNETQSVDKIIQHIRENKIIYIKNKFYKNEDELDLIVKSNSSRVFFIKLGEILIQSHPQV